jgi:ferrochelatase
MTTGVLVMAYGGPDNLDEVEPYLMDVRGGRPTAQHLIDEVRERYRLIGGRSPILERTRDQAAALQSALDARSAPGAYQVFVGMRHWHPYISAALAEMYACGIRRAVGLVMAPHYSKMSIGAYFKRAGEGIADLPDFQLQAIERWHLLPGYLDAMTDRVNAALVRFPAEAQAQVPVIFTAHSLPQRILEWGDPYPHELSETVEALRLRFPGRPIEFAYQSAAMTADPWLGPDAGEAIQRLHAQGRRHVLVAPIGFVCEHVEVLYDIDIVYQQLAEGLGIQLERIEMLNTHPAMIAGLAGLVEERKLN